MKALCRKAVESTVTKEAAVRDQRKCVACQGPIRVLDGEWSCAVCGGRAISFTSVNRRFGSILLSYIAEQTHSYMDPVLGRGCPFCGQRMCVAQLPIRETDGGRQGWRGERVDVCIVCETVWADGGEMI